MSLNKKLLAGAVLAGLAFSANVSAVELGDDPLAFASELADDTFLDTAVDDIMFDIGYNFSGGEVRYGRFECTENMTLDNVVLNEGGGNVALGAINGEGTNELFFSMTGTGAPSEDDTITVVSDNTLEDGGSVSCTFSIYDQPSQAQAGGTTGQIFTTGSSVVIVRESGFVFEMDPTGASQAVADVEAADGSYFHFVGTNEFGNLSFMAVPGVLSQFGIDIQLWDIFTNDTYVTVAGDFSAASDVCWMTYGCADELTDDEARFNPGGGMGDQFGFFQFWETGDAAIDAGTFSATLHADTWPGMVVNDLITADPIGEIVRNGTQLQAPLAQVPGGWLSRIALTNTGAADRSYEISVMGESGNIIGVDSTLLVGLVPGNGTKVIDLNEILLTFSEKRRATLNVTVAAPNNQIQGIYQIVSPDGALSNETMVRPGTN